MVYALTMTSKFHSDCCAHKDYGIKRMKIRAAAKWTSRTNAKINDNDLEFTFIIAEIVIARDNTIFFLHSLCKSADSSTSSSRNYISPHPALNASWLWSICAAYTTDSQASIRHMSENRSKIELKTKKKRKKNYSRILRVCQRPLNIPAATMTNRSSIPLCISRHVVSWEYNDEWRVGKDINDEVCN